MQLWVKGASSPEMIRDKAMEDLDFRQRLLDYIENVASECLPQQVYYDSDHIMHVDASVDNEVVNELVNESSNDQVFQPFPHPDHPDFDLCFERNVFHIVRARQIHSRKHAPTCFKYQSKKCRFRFPRAMVVKTKFDEATGVIYIKRDHPYLNNYNKWFSVMTRGNHDIQFLFTKNHALAIIITL